MVPNVIILRIKTALKKCRVVFLNFRVRGVMSFGRYHGGGCLLTEGKQIRVITFVCCCLETKRTIQHVTGSFIFSQAKVTEKIILMNIARMRFLRK